MSKTFLIGMSNNFSVSANRWLFGLSGSVFLANGCYHLFRNEIDALGLTLGISMIIIGLGYLFSVFFLFSERSTLAPRVKIDQSGIELREGVLKPLVKISWTELVGIEFKPYELTFESTDSSTTFSYNTSADLSRSIKEAVREYAESKGLVVKGG